MTDPTLCDLLGEHSTLLPMVNEDLEHIGFRCAGCAAQAGPDGLLAPPAGLRCFTCGGPMDRWAGPVMLKGPAAFCSFPCLAVTAC